MREASWAAAGMLSPAPDCVAAIPLVPLGRASLALYPNFAGAVEDASGLRTGFRTGGAIEVICHGDAKRELSTLVALHHGLGLACEPLSLEEARNVEPALGRNACAAAFLVDECSIEPRRLTHAVLAAAASAGAALSPGAEVTSLELDGEKCVGVKTSAGEIFYATQVVLAAGCWSSQILDAAPYAPTLPVRGQMVALRHSGTPIRHVLRSERGYLVPRGVESPQTLRTRVLKKESLPAASKKSSRLRMNLCPNWARRKSSRPGADCAPALRINCPSLGLGISMVWSSQPATIGMEICLLRLRQSSSASGSSRGGQASIGRTSAHFASFEQTRTTPQQHRSRCNAARRNPICLIRWNDKIASFLKTSKWVTGCAQIRGLQDPVGRRHGRDR
jgi:hypothetical protein